MESYQLHFSKAAPWPTFRASNNAASIPFEDKLARLQADLTGLRRSHQDMREEVHRRFGTMEARLETMIEEMRRFFVRYEHIDAERQIDRG